MESVDKPAAVAVELTGRRVHPETGQDGVGPKRPSPLLHDRIGPVDPDHFGVYWMLSVLLVA